MGVLEIVARIVARRPRGVAVPRPHGYQPAAAADEDGAEETQFDPDAGDTVASIAGELLRLDYVDSKGDVSSRLVTAQKLRRRGDTVFLNARCHLREAFRTFRVERIQRLSRIKTTGEVIEDVGAWVARLERRDPVSAWLEQCHASVSVLTFVAQCDENFTDEEQKLIAEYVWDASGYDPAVDPARIEDRVESLWPDDTAFRSGVWGLPRYERARAELFKRYLRRVVDSDDLLHESEVDAIMAMTNRR